MDIKKKQNKQTKKEAKKVKLLLTLRFTLFPFCRKSFDLLQPRSAARHASLAISISIPQHWAKVVCLVFCSVFNRHVRYDKLCSFPCSIICYYIVCWASARCRSLPPCEPSVSPFPGQSFKTHTHTCNIEQVSIYYALCTFVLFCFFLWYKCYLFTLYILVFSLGV